MKHFIMKFAPVDAGCPHKAYKFHLILLLSFSKLVT